MRIVDANLLIYAFDKDTPQHAIRKAYGEAGAALRRDVTIGSDDYPSYKGIWGMGTMREFLRKRIPFHRFEPGDFGSQLG